MNFRTCLKAGASISSTTTRLVDDSRIPEAKSDLKYGRRVARTSLCAGISSPATAKTTSENSGERHSRRKSSLRVMSGDGRDSSATEDSSVRGDSPSQIGQSHDSPPESFSTTYLTSTVASCGK